MEQPQYNMFHRDRVEDEYARLYSDIGLGTTTWSPLASGLLTGKYIGGQVPEGSRADQSDGMRRQLTDEARNAMVKKLIGVADELDCSLAQLAIAWCASNPDVTSVITGASRPSQVTENMGALEVLDRLDEETLDRIDSILSD